MKAKHQTIHCAHRRRAAVTLEAILCIPVLVIAFFAVVEFGMILMVHSTITAAAVRGARESAKGRPLSDVQTAIDAVLAVHPGLGPTGLANLRIERNSAPTFPVGSTCVPSSNILPLDPDETRVTICFPLQSGPVVNFLGQLGFDTSSLNYNITAIAVLE